MIAAEVQRAFEIIKNEIPYENDLISKALSIVENAVEKQTPKKPIVVRNEIVCPTCETLVGSGPYCRYCGQALDRSDIK